MVTRKTEPGAWTALVVGLLLVGCDGEPPPIDAPAPRDVPPDVSEDVPLDAPLDLPLTLEEGPSFAGCDPWEVAPETQPRGLPPDATPRLLWRWIPQMDPLWQMAILFPEDDEVQSVARTPDGALWLAVGSAIPRVVRVDREGAARMISTRVQGSRPPIVLPDGRVWLLDIERERVGAVEVAPDGTLRPMQFFVGSEVGGMGVEAAVGPDALYLVVPRAIGSVCPNGSLRWVLRGSPAQYLESPRVDSDGGLWVHMLGPRAIRWVNVSAEGTVAAETGDRATWELAGGETLFVRRSLAGADDEVEVRAGSATRWRAAIEHYSPVCWDARGAAWVQGGVFDGSYPPIRRIDERGTVFETEAGLGLAPTYRCHFAYGEDGSLFGRLVTLTSLDVGARDPRDGRLRWQVSLGPVSGTIDTPIVLGPDGVAYFADGISLVAVQTDMLPPEEPYCLGLYCGNSRLDGAARRFE